jgi:basic amino acid/polyamine antiporter, APA family
MNQYADHGQVDCTESGCPCKLSWRWQRTGEEFGAAASEQKWAGAAAGVIMACFAEVASQFAQAGGPYLYTRAAFGRLVGIEMGWMLWLVRLAAPAATANLFVIYCGEFWPHAANPLPRFLILTFLFGILTLINYRGVRASTHVSDIFTVAKLVPLFLVAIAGAIYLMAGHNASPSSLSATGAEEMPG